jgi:hypothetical protein
VAAALAIFCAVPLAAFVGLGAAAGERSRGTIAFMQSLPVPMWRAAVWKLLFGAIALIVPFLLTVLLFYVSARISGSDGAISKLQHPILTETNRSITGSMFWDGILFYSLAGASLFIWAAAAGVNRKDEVSAAAVAIAVAVGWYLLLNLFVGGVMLVVNERNINSKEVQTALALAISTGPCGFVIAVNSPAARSHLPMMVSAAAVSHIGLLIWYVFRFGRIANAEVRSPQNATGNMTRPNWLGTPRKSPFSAIAWKQYRESAPLALAGIAGCVSITGITVLADAYMGGRWRTEFVGEVYPRMAVVFGMFVALVAGIGVCFNDMQPKINSFWRSRPIQPDAWFWSRFATGLIIVMASTYIPIAVLVALDLADFNSWNVPEAFAIPVAQMALFAAAVMTTCLVRHAVYAAILSMAVVYLGTIGGMGLWFVAALLGWVSVPVEYWWEPSDATMAFGFALSFITSTIIAWLATRYDWGRKSRY